MGRGRKRRRVVSDEEWEKDRDDHVPARLAVLSAKGTRKVEDKPVLSQRQEHGTNLSGFVGMSRTEFRYMLESLVGGAVDGVRAEMVAAQAALKEEIQTALAAVQTTHSLCLLSV